MAKHARTRVKPMKKIVAVSGIAAATIIPGAGSAFADSPAPAPVERADGADTAKGSANGTVQGSANGTARGSAQGTVQGSANGTAKGSASGTSGAVESGSKKTGQRGVDDSRQKRAGETADGSRGGAVASGEGRAKEKPRQQSSQADRESTAAAAKRQAMEQLKRWGAQLGVKQVDVRGGKPVFAYTDQLAELMRAGVTCVTSADGTVALKFRGETVGFIAKKPAVRDASGVRTPVAQKAEGSTAALKDHARTAHKVDKAAEAKEAKQAKQAKKAQKAQKVAAECDCLAVDNTDHKTDCKTREPAPTQASSTKAPAGQKAENVAVKPGVKTGTKVGVATGVKAGAPKASPVQPTTPKPAAAQGATPKGGVNAGAELAATGGNSSQMAWAGVAGMGLLGAGGTSMLVARKRTANGS
ncbi:hypothetical protein ABT160_13830 [Streptomyces sp. NPDC001941]|uniref:hypothetical protein n=1 Tax=Streptomyces sp. NPDC001941 TaxID=3154659 RepID=UPI003327B932